MVCLLIKERQIIPQDYKNAQVKDVRTDNAMGKTVKKDKKTKRRKTQNMKLQIE